MGAVNEAGPKADEGKRQKCQGGVRIAAHGVEQMQRVRLANQCAGTEQGLVEEIVVEVIAVPAETAVEVVPAALGNLEAGDIERIASVAGRVGGQIIEEWRLGIIDRMHFKGLFEDAATGTLVDESVPHGVATGDGGDAATHFERLMDHVTASHFLRWYRGRFGRGNGWRGLRRIRRGLRQTGHCAACQEDGHKGNGEGA